MPRLEVDHGLGACAHVGDQLGARVDQRHDIQAASALAFNTAAAIAAARAREAQQFKLLLSFRSILQLVILNRGSQPKGENVELRIDLSSCLRKVDDGALPVLPGAEGGGVALLAAAELGVPVEDVLAASQEVAGLSGVHAVLGL